MGSCLNPASLSLSLVKISSLGVCSKMKGSGGVFGKGGEEEQSKSAQTPGRGARLSGEEAELCVVFAEIFRSGAAKLGKLGVE